MFNTCQNDKIVEVLSGAERRRIPQEKVLKIITRGQVPPFLMERVQPK